MYHMHTSGFNLVRVQYSWSRCSCLPPSVALPSSALLFACDARAAIARDDATSIDFKCAADSLLNLNQQLFALLGSLRAASSRHVAKRRVRRRSFFEFNLYQNCAGSFYHGQARELAGVHLHSLSASLRNDGHRIEWDVDEQVRANCCCDSCSM